MRPIQQFERLSNWQPHIVIGHFNEREERELIQNGYRKTWQEYKPKPTINKNGIKVDVKC